MQIDGESKIIFVHIPRTGGSWFSYAWNSAKGIGPCVLQGNKLVNRSNNKSVECGKHGRLSGILDKLEKIEYDHAGHKIVTMVRHPVDRALSSWVWFSEVKDTAKKHGWKSIDDMLDEFEGGNHRSNYMPQVFWLEEQNAKFDHIYKFEDVLSNNKIVQKDFPLFNRGYANKNHLRRGRKKTGNEYFNQKQIERIKHLYRDDINFLSEHYKDLK